VNGEERRSREKSVGRGRTQMAAAIKQRLKAAAITYRKQRREEQNQQALSAPLLPLPHLRMLM